MYQPLYVRPLSEEEKAELQRASQSANREESARAAVVLLSAEGKTAGEIGQLLNAHPSNIKKWIRRFNQEGLSGIVVRKRGPQGGPRPRFTQQQIQELLRLYETPPASLGYPFKEWTPQKLATAAMERHIVETISHVTVRQILNRNSMAAGDALLEAEEPVSVADPPRHPGRGESLYERGE